MAKRDKYKLRPVEKQQCDVDAGENGQLNSSSCGNSRLNNQGSNLKTKRKCLDLSEKVAVIDYAEGHPNLGLSKKDSRTL